MSDERLADKIARRIRAEGPLSVAAYMAIVLYDPECGYYTTRSPIGAAGDFITAPEISQIFGELIGVWCALMWDRIGRPEPAVVAELGPGSGALAVDLLRAVQVVPEFRRAIRLHLVEVSAVLRGTQQRRLDTAQAVWLPRFEDLPDGPLLLVANEFLDALPIRQLMRSSGGWAERMVALDAQGRLGFVDGPENQALALFVPPRLREAAPADAIFEICPAAVSLAAMLGARFARWPGAALLIDYGRTRSGIGASLRAVSNHTAADPLAAPGSADLSADVDFDAFTQAALAAGAAVYGPVPQSTFLRQLGAEIRLEALSKGAAAEQRERLESGLRRLLDPDQMGSLFKVLALSSRGLGVPPGFEGAKPT